MVDISSLLSFFNPATYGINLLDIIIVLVVLFYIYEGYTLGFFFASVDLASFILSFIIALKFYPFVAKFLSSSFSVPIGFANAIGFLSLAFLCEVIIGILFRRLMRFLPKLHPEHVASRIFKKVDHLLGLIPGFVSAFIVLSFLLTVIVSLPSSPLIKNLVNDSRLGAKLVANTSFFERKLNDIFGGALSDTLNFITVKPESDETLNLHFSVEQGTVDPQAEQEMLRLVNIEREKAGLAPVVFDDPLRDVARAHSQDMFKRGYFSHYAPEGTSPFDRMADAGIEFLYAGENLALAPSTPLAMQGLMNSPGHRANILNPNFKKLGIGVIDGGIYGKMYSQEFTD